MELGYTSFTIFLSEQELLSLGDRELSKDFMQEVTEFRSAF